MGSLEEDKLFEMVHDFIESEYSTSENPVSSYNNTLPSNDHYANRHHILQEIVESRSAVENGVLGCVLKNLRNKKRAAAAEKDSSLKKWLVMRLRKDGYYGASLCQASWPTTYGCPGGNHEFIEVVIQATNQHGGALRLILDIDFKSQFELARPTPSYKELSDKLPWVFVGGWQKLTKIISILCSEAKQSLKERGLHIPPWRTATYMQSKWVASPGKISLNNTAPKNPELLVDDHQHFSASNFNQLMALTPQVEKAKQRDFVGRSALSCQLANLSTKCC